MFRRTFAFGGALLVAAALVFLTPGPGQAAPHGGFHASGVHAGGVHVGGIHTGGFHAGGVHAGGIHVGGFHAGGVPLGGIHAGGFRYGSYYPYYGGYYRGWPRSLWGFYGGFGYYPYSSSYYSGYYPSYAYGYNYYPYYGFSPYSSGYTAAPLGLGYGAGYSYDAVAPGGSSLTVEQAPAPAPDTRARLTVIVPADAEVWFNGTRTTSTGSVREFTSPPLTPGNRYAYDIKAKWNENGHEVSQAQEVQVAAGSHVGVSFLAPGKNTEQAPTGKQK